MISECSCKEKVGDVESMITVVRVFEPHITVHDVPFEKIVCDNKNGNKLYIEFDDKNEIRYKIDFENYNGLRVTAEDCARWNIIPEVPYYGMMYEIVNSDWISQLKDNSKYTDPETRRYRHIMDNMHHYIIGLGDYYVEIISKGYKLEKLTTT
ncbi:hypothetical protein [Methanolobus sp.]|uniref:hypothetical protein n=1 Tax=Methanolobus sp. TaxID=1874737 RepID=UPI0025D1474A|nr:hypothetical protein [Methanolobus sp.]